MPPNFLDPLGLAAARSARQAMPQVTPEQEQSLLGVAASGEAAP